MDSTLGVNNLEDAQTEIAPENRIAEELSNEASDAVEALLFASPVPLTEPQLARLIGRDKRHIPSIIEQLNGKYAEWGRTFRIEKYGDGFRLYTLPQFDKYISRLAEVPRPARLSRAALEVLSIIAYRQPVMKSEIERIRGIESDGVIRTLIERGFIIISGKSDGPGRPLLYKTTQEFLEFFGISDIAELPAPEIEENPQRPVQAVTLIRPPEEFGQKPNQESIDEAE